MLSNRTITLFLILGLNFGFVPEAKGQILGEYQDGIVDIIKCNDRSGFDLGIVDAISSLLRMVVFLLGILMVSAISFSKSTTVVKTIIYVILAVSGVNMIYEVGIKFHVEQAKDLSVFAASFERQRSFPSDVTPINPGDFGDGTDITNPPIGNGGPALLPPPPPLDGISQGGQFGGISQGNSFNVAGCN